MGVHRLLKKMENPSINGWLFGGLNPSQKYEFVSWDDDVPNIWKVIKAMFQTTNQDGCLGYPQFWETSIFWPIQIRPRTMWSLTLLAVLTAFGQICSLWFLENGYRNWTTYLSKNILHTCSWECSNISKRIVPNFNLITDQQWCRYNACAGNDASILKDGSYYIDGDILLHC